MPRISTDNYDTVASWNGSQDLFVVEQPDGTKVATPAMVKQFMEAGDFEATGEIKDGHGNILKDMAKSAEIGDLSQTGLTGASVAAQLGSVHSLISMINDLPPAATTTPAGIPTGIRIHFNIGSQTAGYPLGNALYVSIKLAESRCVQILFENGATTPEGKYRTVLNSTTWSDWKAF